MELSLLMRGRKLFGSLLNVISSSDRKRFIPASRLWGLRGEIPRECRATFKHRAVATLDKFPLLLRVCRGTLGGNAVKHDDSVGQVCRHDEVVLYHKRRLLGVEDVPVGVHVQKKEEC